MADSDIIDRLLEQTSHLVRQAWAPVVLQVQTTVCFIVLCVFLALQAEESSGFTYRSPQASRFGGSRPFR